MEIEKDYLEILRAAIKKIKTARVAIAREVNGAANGVYWNIGKLLAEKKIEKRRDAGLVNRLSVDLKMEFPDLGLSPRNLWNMKRFYERYYQADPKLQRCVAVLPWGHDLLLLKKISNDEKALHYAQRAIALGWSRDTLLTI